MNKTEKEKKKNERRDKVWKIHRGYEYSIHKRNLNDHVGKERYWTSLT